MQVREYLYEGIGTFFRLLTRNHKTDFALVDEVIMLAMQMVVGWSEG